MRPIRHSLIKGRRKEVPMRAHFRQCVAEFHQFSGSRAFNVAAASRRKDTAEIAGLAAASCRDGLGGLLAVW